MPGNPKEPSGDKIFNCGADDAHPAMADDAHPVMAGEGPLSTSLLQAKQQVVDADLRRHDGGSAQRATTRFNYSTTVRNPLPQRAGKQRFSRAAWSRPPIGLAAP